jgi:hypothetical protein
MALKVDGTLIQGVNVGAGVRTDPYFQRAWHPNQIATESAIVTHYRKTRRNVTDIGIEFNIDRLEGRIEVSTKNCHYYDSFYVDIHGNAVVMHAPGRGSYKIARPYVCAQALEIKPVEVETVGK